MVKAILALEDGRIFEGRSFGATGEKFGEVVFNTSMSGYQEILTDPSYKGQIVAMTYPLIGNYGVNDEDVESRKVYLEAFVVKENSPVASNWRSKGTLSDYLARYGVVGIEGIDTRALTRHVRIHGAMRAVVSTEDLDPASLVAKAKASPSMVGRNLVADVTTDTPYVWNAEDKGARRFNVAAFDFGVKYNILRMLDSLGCRVTVVPAAYTAEQVLALNPDGIFLSNGPGDPEAVTEAIESVRNLLGKKPILGICLGHQILGLAYGGSTYKLKFGHHGANHPVLDSETNTIGITSQNHGFCVDLSSLDRDKVEVTHMNLNDNTVEGIRRTDIDACSVQHHPEASPGPHDASPVFKTFISMMEKAKA